MSIVSILVIALCVVMTVVLILLTVSFLCQKATCNEIEVQRNTIENLKIDQKATCNEIEAQRNTVQNLKIDQDQVRITVSIHEHLRDHEKYVILRTDGRYMTTDSFEYMDGTYHKYFYYDEWKRILHRDGYAIRDVIIPGSLELWAKP